MSVSACVRRAVVVVGSMSVNVMYRILSFDLHLTQWNAAQRARQAPSAAWSAVHFARPARTPKSQAHGISMIAAVATAVWLGRAARIASWPAVVTRPARTKRSRPEVWMVFGGQRRPCVTITRAVVAIDADVCSPPRAPTLLDEPPRAHALSMAHGGLARMRRWCRDRSWLTHLFSVDSHLRANFRLLGK